MSTSWTQAEGRQKLSRVMHGAESFKGSAAATFSTTTFSLSSLAAYPDSYFNDWHGRVYAGPLIGTNFSVDSFEQDFGPTFIKGYFTIKPVQSAAFQVGDFIELHQEYSPQEMDDAINLALSLVENEALEDHMDDSLVGIESTFEYQLPQAFAYIDEIYQMNDDDTLGGKNKLDIRWWSILPGRVLWFNRDFFKPSSNRKFRIIGQKYPQQLTKDDDISSVNQAYVLLQAKSNLHLARSDEPGDDQDKAMLRSQALADRERAKLLVPGRGPKVAF
jgi:hypothetical protein